MPPKPINVTDDAQITFGIKGMWALIVLVFMFGSAITAFQLNTNHKIETMYLQNQHDHQVMMTTISEISQKQNLYVLKQQLENGWVFVHNRYDKIHNFPTMTASEELEFRKQIRDFLDTPTSGVVPSVTTTLPQLPTK